MAPATDRNNGNTISPSSDPNPATTQNGNVPPSSASTSSVGDHLAQALKDLARGEQTASALETNLTSLESRLDELLASFGILPEDEESNLPDDDDGEQHENGDQKTTLNGKEADAPPKKGDS